MNKKVNTLLIICGLVWIIFILPDLILSEASIEWKVILILLFIVFLITFIFSFVLRFQEKKIYQLIMDNKMDIAIQKLERLKKKHVLPYFNEQFMSLNIAIISLQNEDTTTFETYIDKIDHKKFVAIKYYWKTIALLLNNQLNEAVQTYELFLNSPKNIVKGGLDYKSFEMILSGFMSYYRGDEQQAFQKLTLVRDKIQNKLTRTLCDDILAKQAD